ncbi:MAG: ankyrin repeat protein [Chlamydiales bacterium]|jgi:ankyrin repeat protein
MNVNLAEALPDNVNSQILHFLIGDHIGEGVVRNGVVHIPKALEAIREVNRALQSVALMDRNSNVTFEGNSEIAERLAKQFYEVFPRDPLMGFLQEDCVSAVSSLHTLSRLSFNRFLRQAAKEGSTELAQALIYLKADVSKVGESQKAPLHIALDYGREDIVDLLISSGANIEQRRQLDDTPIFLAAELGNPSLLSRMIKAGANIKMVNCHKLTPLHIASRYGNANCVSILLEAKALVNAQNTNKRTALHLAAHHGHLAVVRVLLKGGANPKLKDIKGKAAFWVAKANAHNDIVEVLEEVEKKSSGISSLLHCCKR